MTALAHRSRHRDQERGEGRGHTLHSTSLNYLVLKRSASSGTSGNEAVAEFRYFCVGMFGHPKIK